MFKIWKLNTIAFLIQVVLSWWIYLATGTSEDTIFVSIGIFASMIFILFDEFVADVFGITLLVFFVVMIFPVNIPLGIAFLLGAIVLTAGVVRRARKEGAKESSLLLSIAALPFGVGTIVGGPILAYRWFRDRKVT